MNERMDALFTRLIAERGAANKSEYMRGAMLVEALLGGIKLEELGVSPPNWVIQKYLGLVKGRAPYDLKLDLSPASEPHEIIYLAVAFILDKVPIPAREGWQERTLRLANDYGYLVEAKEDENRAAKRNRLRREKKAERVPRIAP